MTMGAGGVPTPPEDDIIYEHPQMNAKGHRYCTNWHEKLIPSLSYRDQAVGEGKKNMSQ